MTTLALAGLGIVLAPWLHRSRSALNEARAAKVRADARADMAAHLHDSVLQTLALIQRQADDPKAVQQLARRQERELRTWLYGDEVPETTLKAALTAAAAEVEDERGIPVELVVVGDCETSDPVQALVRAAREAMVNAAKHSGADKIDVYAEVTDELVEVFVRDRGQGFDARRRARGPDGCQRQHHQPDGAARRDRQGPLHAGRRNRSTTGDQTMTEATPTAPVPPAERGPYRVVVVDDHAMFRTGVKAEIGRSVAVVGEAADADTAIKVVLATQPDVVLLDVHLPGGGGVEVLRKVHEKAPDQKFLALSVSDAAEDVIGVIRAGARGYVTKSISGPELIDAIRRVGEGDAVFSPRLAGFVLDAFSGAIDLATVDEDLDRLSNREREVLRLIARGYAYKEVAKELFISIKTVETHVSSVLRKLQLSNRHQLTRWATDRRLV